MRLMQSNSHSNYNSPAGPRYATLMKRRGSLLLVSNTEVKSRRRLQKHPATVKHRKCVVVSDNSKLRGFGCRFAALNNIFAVTFWKCVCTGCSQHIKVKGGGGGGRLSECSGGKRVPMFSLS